MQHKHKITWFVILAVLLSALPGFAWAAPAAQQSGNLLTNPGFEGEFVGGSDEMQVAAGWTPWWIPRQEGQPDWQNQKPRFESTAHPQRVRSGSLAQSLASFYSSHTAGLYQQVSVANGADLRFTAYGKGWTSVSDDPLNSSVGGTDLRMRVGIDPFGGTDPLSVNVRWSDQVNAADSWVRFDAYAKAQSTTVTVFLYSAPFDARRHNDVYWDDAELVSLSGDAAATAQAFYPTPTPTPIIFTPTPVTVPLGENLLKNPGFEGSWFNPCSWKGDLPWNHIPCTPWYKELMVRWNTVYTPQDWTAWWQPPITDTTRSDFYTYPNRCPTGAPETCVVWHNPEYGTTDWIRNGPPRIHSGKNSLKYFTFWSVHEAGVFQTVEGITPGSQLRFGGYMHAWSAKVDASGTEPSPFKSDGQISMHMKIGIDPTGGRNPWSGDIVWSPERDTYDQFGYYQVTAVAASDKVTVFTYTRPQKAMKHNDVYVDDLELVAVSIPGGSAAPPPPPQPQPAPADTAPIAPAGPRPTSTPRPDGARVHVVQPGDTLFGLSLQYDVSMDQIIRLNGISPEAFLQINQELVIALPESAGQPTPAPAVEAAPTETTTDIATLDTGRICVRAFTDANEDGVISAGETLAGGIVFILQNAQNAIVATRTTDGLSEPHCFEQPAGDYSLLIQVPAGRTATTITKWPLALAAGTQIDVDFGSRPDGSNAGSVTSRAAPSGGDADRALSGILGILLLGLAGAGLLWVMRTRRQTTR